MIGKGSVEDVDHFSGSLQRSTLTPPTISTPTDECEYDEVSEPVSTVQNKKNRTIISVGEEGSATSSLADGDVSTPPSLTPSISGVSSLHRQAKVEVCRPFSPNNFSQDELNTLRRSKFSTLRTTKLVAREMEEYKRENNIYEQMVGYKRLRQQHHKEMKQLEERCQMEKELLRQKQEKENDQVLQQCQKELGKVQSHQKMELEKKNREHDEAMRKLRKQRLAHNEHQLKAFVNCQKKEYKHNKEVAKTVSLATFRP